MSGGHAPRWAETRVKSVSSFVTSGSRGWAEYYADEGALFLRIANVSGEGIELDLEDVAYVRVPTGAEGERTRVRKNDVLVSITALIGAVALVREDIGDAYVNQHLALVRPTHAVDPRWLAYYLASEPGQSSFRTKMAGGTKLGLGLDDVREARVLLPPRETQAELADILDRKTAAIDALAAKKERLIELLQEKRQALITQAVTKGLDPSVPMKESGIEWLGEIPAHWQLQRGRFLYSQRASLPCPDDGVVTAFRDGQVTLRTNRRTEGYTFAEKEVGYQRVHAGDLVVHSMDAFAGAIGVSESTGKCSPEYQILTPQSPNTSNHYYSALLRLMALRGYVYVICPSVRERAPRFRYETFRDVLLPVPPPHEQRAIVEHVARLSPALTRTAGVLRRQLEHIREYRQALITAAVTGKLDIPPEE